MVVVPDASVILKWVLQKEGERDTPQALDLLDAFLKETIEIRLPSLWRYEVGNILGLKQAALATALMSALLGYEFQEEPLVQAYCLAVLDHMRGVKGITFYDSSYHVLALRTEGQYVTADEEYLRKARRKGSIALLADWRAPSASG